MNAVAEKSLSREPGRNSISELGPPSGEVVDRRTSIVSKEGHIVNASGHRDSFQRQYGLLSVCSLALTIDNAWVALGGSLSVAILNGGPPGILYEFIVACVFYSFIAASIAELASAVPTSGSIYHWASITPGKRFGRIIGFFAGYLNFFGWIFDLASIISIPANVVVEMYAVFHPAFVPRPWHSYIAFIIITWGCTAVVVFLNRFMPHLQRAGLFLVVVGGLVTIIVVATMPDSYATNAFVWTDFVNLTGWNTGIAFLAGVLNGCFAIGTTDAITHCSEELPSPKVDLPTAIFLQVALGFATTFVYAIAILYGINNLDTVTSNNLSFPLAEVYKQATGSAGATFGLLLIVLFSMLICAVSTVLMVGRLFFTLARDVATPFPTLFSAVNEELSCPIPATILCAILCTALGAVQLGSKTAFTSLVGSFVTLTTASYFLTIAPHMLTGRATMSPGPFWMGNYGYIVNGITCALILLFNVWFCWPYAYPVTVESMNWNSVIFVGVFMVTLVCWVLYGIRYPGPKVSDLHSEATEISADSS